MWELVARGPDPQQSGHLPLEAARDYQLGRDPTADLCIEWDASISRRHVELSVRGRTLSVKKLPTASNDVFFAGGRVERCDLQPGEHFVLGTTSFTFSRRGSSAAATPPVEEVSFSRQALERVRFQNADERLEVLSHLPDAIGAARTESELFLRLVNLLLGGIVRAEAVAIVELPPDAEQPLMRYSDRRKETAGAVRPSSRLTMEALRIRRENVLHVWDLNQDTSEFTASAEFDWAFCTPIPGPENETLGFYVTGRHDRASETLGLPHEQLQADIKFTELVAEFVGTVRRLNQLERQEAGLRRLLPPVILSELKQGFESPLLSPREAEVTVMFCDLRGFSRHAEISRHDLGGLLKQVSRALGEMTHCILEHGGVIGDFQGDSVMGFWGWPKEAGDGALHASRAALAIRRAFSAAHTQPQHPLAPFDLGIGIAGGRAVAGRIGTDEHAKFTVFGLVVNLASRLEGMTKHLRVPILMDEVVAEAVKQGLPGSEGRQRRLGRVLPFGMETPVVVSQLLPPASEQPELTAKHLVSYEAAVDHFQAGRWDAAHALLRELPASDRAQDFLTAQITQHNRMPPPGWNGVVVLPSK